MSKDIISISSEEPVERAAQMMQQHDIGSIPVCTQNKLIGMVTDRDITLRSVAAGQDTKQQKISDIMTANPAMGNPQMDVNEAAKMMSEKQIRRLPIVENNNLVGIVSLGDISVEPSLQDNAEEALKNISEPCQVGS